MYSHRISTESTGSIAPNCSCVSNYLREVGLERDVDFGKPAGRKKPLVEEVLVVTGFKDQLFLLKVLLWCFFQRPKSFFPRPKKTDCQTNMTKYEKTLLGAVWSLFWGGQTHETKTPRWLWLAPRREPSSMSPPLPAWPLGCEVDGTVELKKYYQNHPKPHKSRGSGFFKKAVFELL